MKRVSIPSKTGFTLIELVAVIVLLGVLSVSVLPRFGDTNILDVYTAKDQIVAAIRLAQQQAMYDSINCYRMDISNNVLSVQLNDESTVPSSWRAVGPSAGWKAGIELDDSIAVTDTSIYFTYLGDAHTSGCDAFDNLVPAPVITIGNPVITSISVNRVGYVRSF